MFLQLAFPDVGVFFNYLTPSMFTSTHTQTHAHTHTRTYTGNALAIVFSFFPQFGLMWGLYSLGCASHAHRRTHPHIQKHTHTLSYIYTQATRCTQTTVRGRDLLYTADCRSGPFVFVNFFIHRQTHFHRHRATQTDIHTFSHMHIRTAAWFPLPRQNTADYVLRFHYWLHSGVLA